MKPRVLSARVVLPVFVLSALLGGCTTHYRESLAAYREAEPTPFYQRTLDWAEESSGAVAPSEPEEATRDALQPPETADRNAIVAASVLGLQSDEFTSRAAALEGAESKEARLRGAVRWQDVMLLVALDNPEVEAARREWQATVHQYSQADYLDGLLREYQVFTRSLKVGAGAPVRQGMSKEFFPYPSLTSLKGEMLREQIRLAELAWARTLRDTLVDAGSVFFDYQFQHQGEDTVAENVKLLEDLVGVVQDRYATGLATQPDVLKLQGELEGQRNLLLDFQARQRVRKAELNAYLGRPAGAPLGRPAATDLPYAARGAEQLIETALAHRQEVLEQESKVARTEIAIRMGEIMSRPLASQGYSTLDRGMMPDVATGEPTAPFGAQADGGAAPVAYAQTEAYLAEMRERLAAAKALLEQERLDASAQARGALEQVRIAQRQLELLRDVVLPLNQSAYDITLRAYTVGEATFIELFDTERKLIETRLALDEQRSQRNIAVLALARVRGGDIAR